MLNMQDIFDDELCQSVTRIVRREQVNQWGEAEAKFKRTTIPAVVTSATAGDLNRFTDATTYTKTIKVTTAHNLNPDNVGGQSDIIVFEGDNYEVVGVDNYKNNGYTRAICSLIDFEVRDVSYQ